MSDTTPTLSLPYLMPAQAQKHVTHNEALLLLDALVQLRVQAFDAQTPPLEPAVGASYALGASPTGAWAGQASYLAIWQGEGWLFIAPQIGWRAWGETPAELRVWQGASWELPGFDTQNLPQLGVNTTADANTPLSVSGPASLFTHAGSDHQLKLNKASSSDTAAVLFQSDWSGRAEMGLLGNNDFSIKLSSNGSAWAEAIRLGAADGTLHGQAGQFASFKIGEGQATDIPLSLHSSDANCYLSLNDNNTGSNGSVALLATGDDLKLRAGGSNHITLLASGNTGLNVSNPNVRLRVRETENNTTTIIENENAALSTSVLTVDAARTANAAFDLLRCYSGGFGDMEFRLSGDGNGSCDGSWTGGGADYAEWFEWADGNPNQEDRRGLAVLLAGNKIRPAAAGEIPFGVISANPSVVGDGDIDRWKQKYLRDAFGSYLWEEPDTDNQADAETEEGQIQQRRRLNPAYDPERPYVPRAKRPEWAMVGMMGKLRLRQGQPTDPRWIRMREVSAEVEEWLLR